MGEHEVRQSGDSGHRRQFMQQLLNDVRALETMLDGGLFETDVTRIGAEQELFLVDSNHRPALKAMEALAAIDDPHFTTELAQFNLEINLDPLELGETCLRQLEAQLHEMLEKARRGAAAVGAEVVLNGILPTLDKNDLSYESMTPLPRYRILSDAFKDLRGSAFQFNIKGRDELSLTHDTVMLEACNTSFQIHFQVSPDQFVDLYNIAQAVAGPALAAATFSPLLLGHRLWHETRIALFQQAVDTRHMRSHRRQQQPRVSFGERWIEHSVLDIFREDIARFRLLISRDLDENPFEELRAGRIPKLKALCLHNGTVYRWNRPCYGISGGKPHLRIENRILPSGPTVVDEMANAAFWFGIIKALYDQYGDITRELDFDHAKDNFLAAARQGLKAQFHWFGDRSLSARRLICEELLPLAHQGLDALGIGREDAERYLGVLSDRVESGRTGSQWMLDSLAAMKLEGSSSERMACLVSASISRQQDGKPVHTWAPAKLRETHTWRNHYLKVSSLMSTDLFTVNEDEVIDLVASLMDWRHIRHIPVEDNEHRLVGLVTYRTLVRLVARFYDHPNQRPIPVRDVMHVDLVTVTPETPTLDAVALMKKHKIACLPVVEHDKLVGILTERDFMRISEELLEEFLVGE